MSRPQIFLGELITALDRLAVDSTATASAVLTMLSLESAQALALAVSEPGPAPEREPVTERTDTAPFRAPQPVRPDSPAPEIPVAGTTTAGGGRGLRATVQRVEVASPPTARPAWVDAVPELSRERGSYEADLDPLVDPRQSRAVVTGLAAAIVDDGDIDLARAIEVLARGLPLREIPRQREWSLRRGVQILVDEGPGMAPFAGDTSQLISRAREFVPADRFDVLRFSSGPLRGCRVAGRRGSRAWTAPRRGTPILVLSDLGLADAGIGQQGADVDEWLRFAEETRAEGVPLRTLTPYPTARYSPLLVRAVRAIAWDRRTTAAAVRRALAASSS